MPIVNDLVPYILSHNDKIDFYKSKNKQNFFWEEFRVYVQQSIGKELIVVEYQSK